MREREREWRTWLLLLFAILLEVPGGALTHTTQARVSFMFSPLTFSLFLTDFRLSSSVPDWVCWKELLLLTSYYDDFGGSCELKNRKNAAAAGRQSCEIDRRGDNLTVSHNTLSTDIFFM